MRSAQVWSLGKPSSGVAAGPKFCRKYQGRMIGGEIGEASGGALQERTPVSQRLIQPSEMRAQLIKMVGPPPPSLRRDRYFGRRT